MTIPTETCVAGFIVSMGQLEETSRGLHYVRARVGARVPMAGADRGAGAHGAETYFFLIVYGDAAERVSRRFRKGDRFIAAGMTRDATFVATHIGHDATCTRYRVVRTPTRKRRGQQSRPSRRLTTVTPLAHAAEPGR